MALIEDRVIEENTADITSTLPRKKPERKTRTVRVFIRLLPEEKSRFEDMCQSAGVTQADYFRRKILNTTMLRKRQQPSFDTKALCQILGHLGRIGNNLNQLARMSNSGFAPANENLEHVQSDINIMRRTLQHVLTGKGDNQ